MKAQGLPYLPQFSSARQLRDDDKIKIETTQYYEQILRSVTSEHKHFAVCRRIHFFFSPQAELV